MLDLFERALSGDAAALGGLASLVAILAIIPSATFFIINQWHQNRLLRHERHRYVSERYQTFLEKCVDFPQFRLGDFAPVPDDVLTADERYQRDMLFDLLTTIFENAYLAYANRVMSYRRRQWGGWEAYIQSYLRRSDYRDWWLRIMLEGDLSILQRDDEQLRALNITQFDHGFERYMIRSLRACNWTGLGGQPSRAPAGIRSAQHAPRDAPRK